MPQTRKLGALYLRATSSWGAGREAPGNCPGANRREVVRTRLRPPQPSTRADSTGSLHKEARHTLRLAVLHAHAGVGREAEVFVAVPNVQRPKE